MPATHRLKQSPKACTCIYAEMMGKIICCVSVDGWDQLGNMGTMGIERWDYALKRVGSVAIIGVVNGVEEMKGERMGGLMRGCIGERV